MNLRQLVIELVEEISVNELPIYSSAAIARIEFAIQSAILAEREACAKICQHSDYARIAIFSDWTRSIGDCLANEIRARSSENKAPKSAEVRDLQFRNSGGFGSAENKALESPETVLPSLSPAPADKN